MGSSTVTTRTPDLGSRAVATTLRCSMRPARYMLHAAKLDTNIPIDAHDADADAEIVASPALTSQSLSVCLSVCVSAC